MCDKAVSEQGQRLNIRKATLREWRREFARHLRQQGIAANATERAVRGESRIHKTDGIYRATLRGDSSHTRARAEAAAVEFLNKNPQPDLGKATLMETRRVVERGWRATSDVLLAQGRPELAEQVRRFVNQMHNPLSEKEQLRAQLAERLKSLDRTLTR